MSVFPDAVSFPQFGRNTNRRADVDIQNFGKEHWASLNVESTAEWVDVVSERTYVAPGDTLPREIWRAVVSANSSSLGPGRHEALVTVKPDGAPTGASRGIPVVATVVSPVSAIPAQLFFGRVVAGESATKSITLRFSPGAMPRTTDLVAISHRLGGDLQIKLRKRDSLNWELEAELTMSSATSISNESVELAFGDSQLPRLELPIYAVSCEGQ